MKRAKIYIFLMLLGMVFILNGCSKKDEPKTLSCDELSANFSNALVAFSSNPTEATCAAYEEAVVDFLEGCSYYAGYDRAELQQWIDENDCSEYGTGK
ncbi:MAG TPA: hypothetical protein VJ346_04645 [Bacteroidales bacterium]|nr:hypothetical protein [Bacteroidales bacterium]